VGERVGGWMTVHYSLLALSHSLTLTPYYSHTLHSFTKNIREPMLVIFLAVFLTVSCLITKIFVLVPLHVFEIWHAPSWLLWTLLAIALSWLMSD
jgi:hypothetical protein